MQKISTCPARVLSFLIAGLASVSSIGGLVLGGLYLGTEFVNATWLGNDLATLLVAVPLLLGSSLLAGRGSLRAQLVWIGMLDYMLYNFAFYLFGAAFNLFFFVYVILLALSIWALILVLMSLDIDRIAASFVTGASARAVAAFLAFVGVTLTIVYFLQWLGFATNGDVPQIVAMSGHPTHLVFALDLSIVVPVLLVGSILLWRRKHWGIVLAVMGNVKRRATRVRSCDERRGSGLAILHTKTPESDRTHYGWIWGLIFILELLLLNCISDSHLAWI